MKTGFIIENDNIKEFITGIIVTNYPKENKIVHYGFWDIESAILGAKSVLDVGVWRPKNRCHDCQSTKGEIWPCEKCGNLYCESHSASYNQFSQIDYNCCESCAQKQD